MANETGQGLLSGAMSGAGTGMAVAGPWGAVVGGIFGAFLGAGQARKDIEDKETAEKKALFTNNQASKPIISSSISASQYGLASIKGPKTYTQDKFGILSKIQA